MTDEQRPWRAWPEWMLISPDYDVQKNALAARVWREASSDADAKRHVAFERWDEEQKRADAAEAQRDRLAAALLRAAHAMEQYAPSDQRWVAALTAAHAALADVREVVQNVLDNPEAMAAISQGWEEIQRGEPGVPVSELRRKDDHARRRDEAYRAMVEALTAAMPYIQGQPGSTIALAEAQHALALARQVEE